MYCEKCGNLCNDNEAYCSNCGNSLCQPTRKKKGKKKIIIGVLLVVCVVAIAGAAFVLKKNSDEIDLYDTYLYGTWEGKYNEINKNNDKHVDYTVTFNKDGSVISKTEAYEDGEISYNSEGKGNITDIETINDEVDHIKLSWGDMYKYKNLLGDYYDDVKTPEGKTFDLIVKQSGNAALIFRKDGTIHSCVDYKNCNNDDCGGGVGKYKRKGQYIYYLNEKSWIRGTVILDNGLFYDTYIKSEE